MDGRDRGGLNLYLPRAAHLSESARGRHRIGSISAFRHAIPIILPARHHPVFHPVQDRTGLAFLFFPVWHTQIPVTCFDFTYGKISAVAATTGYGQTRNACSTVWS
jgi:hypothetical protein